MFDLEVEATVPEVGDRVGCDVPACQYLPAYEVQLTLPLQNGHGFVVGCEDRDHIGAEETAMDGDEEQRLQRFQHPEQQTQVQREVRAERQGFDQRALGLLRGEELDAAAQHADRLQEREGEYKGGLVFHDEPRESPLAEGLLFLKSEQRDVHVGIDIHLVRVPVVLVVLVDPPLAAQAEQQVAENEGEPVVLPGAAEGELPVTEVVGEEAYLDKDEGEIDGIQKLEPAVAENEQQAQADSQQSEGEGRLARVVGGLRVQQPVLFDQALQLGVPIGPQVGRGSLEEGNNRFLAQLIGRDRSVCVHGVRFFPVGFKTLYGTLCLLRIFAGVPDRAGGSDSPHRGLLRVPDRPLLRPVAHGRGH